MPDYKLNHLSSLLYESYYPRAGVRFNLSQTATEIRGKSETKLHRVAGVIPCASGEKRLNFSGSRYLGNRLAARKREMKVTETDSDLRNFDLRCDPVLTGEGARNKFV
jgi:hypothetical protein